MANKIYNTIYYGQKDCKDKVWDKAKKYKEKIQICIEKIIIINKYVINHMEKIVIKNRI